ncbi:MAG: hypothetical protein AB8B80_09005 [Marinicellaceae bacterium]
MSTQSKSNPLLFIIIAVVILFIAAIIYKNLTIDNSEEITVPKITALKDSEPKKKREYDFSPTADIPALPDEDVDQYAHLSKEEKQKKISKNLNKYTMYRTPEQVMETIYKLKELGREDEAEEFIDFLVKRFPDYEMN